MILLVALLLQEPAEVLNKLAERMKDAKTMTCQVRQVRKTALVERPLVSSGTMAYRREPGRLVFRLTEPRTSEIHMDRRIYQVYRPDEKRLERTEFGSEDVSGKILMMFEPKADELGKTFAIRGGGAKDGLIEVRLESSDEKVRKRLRKIVLTLGEADGALRSLSYTDGEGDDVKFDLSDVEINSALAPDLFALKVPEGTRVLRNSLPQDK